MAVIVAQPLLPEVQVLVDEARSRGLQYVINDLRSYARATRDRMEADGVRLDSRQTWACVEAAIAMLEANVSRETSHAHGVTWIDPLLLQLGQEVLAYRRDPISAGDAPVAIGTFVHVVAEGSLDRDATAVLDDAGEVHRLLIRDHHFALSKG